MTAPASAPDPVAALLALFDLEPCGADTYRAFDPGTWPGGAMFGGQLAAQSLRAASFTVPDEQLPHSLHCYFLRPGRVPGTAEFRVQRLRDGGSFSTREITVTADDAVVATVLASFHVGEDGKEYQLPAARVEPPGAASRAEALADLLEHRGIDVRELATPPQRADGTYESTRRAWMRVARPLPDDPVLHACLIAYMSDIGAHSATRLPVVGPLPRKATPGVMSASIDHSVWLHRPARADEWVLYDLHSLTNQSARGLSRGVFHQRGSLVASVCQEVLIRVRRPEQ